MCSVLFGYGFCWCALPSCGVHTQRLGLALRPACCVTRFAPKQVSIQMYRHHPQFHVLLAGMDTDPDPLPVYILNTFVLRCPWLAV